MRILRLENETIELQGSREITRRMHTNFSDIEKTLSKFSGDDGYSVIKWFSDFEEITTIPGCGTDEKLMFARRVVSRSAVCFYALLRRCLGWTSKISWSVHSINH